MNDLPSEPQNIQEIAGAQGDNHAVKSKVNLKSSNKHCFFNLNLKNSLKNKKFFYLIIFSLLFAAGFSLVYFARTKPSTKTKNLSNTSKFIEISSAPSTPTPTQKVKKSFLNVDDRLLSREKVNIEVQPGYYLVASYLSHAEDRLVYSQIEENIFEHFGRGGGTSKYEVLMKDMSSGAVSTLISEEVLESGNFLPIGWSPNDKYLLLKMVNFTDIGRGFGSSKFYDTYRLKPDTKNPEGLGYWPSVIVGGNGIVVYLDSSDIFGNVCHQAYGSVANSGKVVAKNVETGKSTTILEETYTNFLSLEFNQEKGFVGYDKRAVGPETEIVQGEECLKQEIPGEVLSGEISVEEIREKFSTALE